MSGRRHQELRAMRAGVSRDLIAWINRSHSRVPRHSSNGIDRRSLAITISVLGDIARGFVAPLGIPHPARHSRSFQARQLIRDDTYVPTSRFNWLSRLTAMRSRFTRSRRAPPYHASRTVGNGRPASRSARQLSCPFTSRHNCVENFSRNVPPWAATQ